MNDLTTYEINTFAQHMVDIGEFTDPQQVLDYYEKPWKWVNEIRQYMKEDE